MKASKLGSSPGAINDEAGDALLSEPVMEEPVRLRLALWLADVSAEASLASLRAGAFCTPAQARAEQPP